MRALLRWIPAPARQAVSRSAEWALPLGFRGRNYLQGLDVNLNDSLPMLATLFDRSNRRLLLPKTHFLDPRAEDIFASRVPAEKCVLERSTRMDFGNYLPEDILVKADRASMMHALELRAPFLDVDVVDFAFSKVPGHLKATSADKKILLKALARDLLPASFDHQRKQGFSIPLGSWLLEKTFRGRFEDVLLDKSCMFDQAHVRYLFNAIDKGRAVGERLFALLMIELWRSEFDIEIPDAIADGSL